ncbi:hypothetical protein [Methanoculleus sp.]|uniref:hypothetical protein n=1 Tax=Methanoculleus sp. TaxID=90427 RepID=UPI00260E8B5A|nr:hypothetical protein [Methanoculleus sp.]MDD2787628.1 hypothetical protein [Methanoculleus sp.]
MWRSTAMRAASGMVERVTPPEHPVWHSCTMQTLESVTTPGTIPNIAVSLAVTTLVIPLIPNRFIAAAAGFAVGSVLRG